MRREAIETREKAFERFSAKNAVDYRQSIGDHQLRLPLLPEPLVFLRFCASSSPNPLSFCASQAHLLTPTDSHPRCLRLSRLRLFRLHLVPCSLVRSLGSGNLGATGVKLVASALPRCKDLTHLSCVSQSPCAAQTHSHPFSSFPRASAVVHLGWTSTKSAWTGRGPWPTCCRSARCSRSSSASPGWHRPARQRPHSRCPPLRACSLDYNNLGDAGTKVIAFVLPQCKAITTIK